MATTSLQSLHHHSFLRRHHHHHHHLHFDTNSSSSLHFSLFLKPTTTTTTISLSSKFSSTTHFTLFSSTTTTTTTSTTSPNLTFDLLEKHLSSKDFRQADEETRRLLIVLAGEAAEKRGYVFFSEVQFIDDSDLQAMDNLWRQYSDNKFGFSVQKRIWEKMNQDFTEFFKKVGWMKKLDTEMEQYNYRSFPTEFIWELKDDTPEGHLPLTNALRGTQLLKNIFTHPAFQSAENEGNQSDSELDEPKLISKPFSKTLLKTDYSF